MPKWIELFFDTRVTTEDSYFVLVGIVAVIVHSAEEAMSVLHYSIGCSSVKAIDSM